MIQPITGRRTEIMRSSFLPSVSTESGPVFACTWYLSNSVTSHIPFLVCHRSFSLSTWSLWRKPIVLVWAADRIPQTGGLINRNLFFTFLESGQSRIIASADLVRAQFLVYKSPSSCCVFTSGRSRGAHRGLFVRALILLVKALPSWPSHLTKGPHFLISLLGLGFQHMNFRGTQTIQPIPTTCFSIVWL